MNSLISEDLTREHLALDATKCVENIYARSLNITSLHKELLEINLSITAYIEESKRRLESLRLQIAQQANSAYKVVEVFSEKCKKMTSTPSPPRKRRIHNMKTMLEDNNNMKNKFSEHQQARTFIQWYKHMIDNERANFALYLSDDAVLEWFGRTIKTSKKVAAFLKFDMQCSRHDFTTVESIDKIHTRQDERLQRKEHGKLASPLQSPELKEKSERPVKRRLLRSNCNSPEWADGCKPSDDEPMDKKRAKTNAESVELEQSLDTFRNIKRLCSDETLDIIDNKGDGILGKRNKRQCLAVTPSNKEVGQGDCLPSTSGTDSNKSHENLNAQLPKRAVECNGYIEFTRTRNNRSTDAMNWERKCKVQISYSEDPLNVGEYIIWALRYTDESKCRRNLLSAFEEVAMEEGVKNV